MIKNVRESLAGRVGILTLCGLSQMEKSGIAFEENKDNHVFSNHHTKNKGGPTSMSVPPLNNIIFHLTFSDKSLFIIRTAFIFCIISAPFPP
ncbi:MAG: hypothetical protein HDT21_08935 [Ruminococcus sp.]|nr:hypothetical protein [Ruminococcus sp.]